MVVVISESLYSYVTVFFCRLIKSLRVFPYILSKADYVSGYVHTAPFSFLSVFVDENAVRSHCSVFK